MPLPTKIERFTVLVSPHGEHDLDARCSARLEEAGVRLTKGGYIEVDKVSRTSARGVYAAGDCTGVLPLGTVGSDTFWSSFTVSSVETDVVPMRARTKLVLSRPATSHLMLYLHNRLWPGGGSGARRQATHAGR